MIEPVALKNNLLEESSPLVREFLGYQLTVRGRSVNTVSEYGTDLRTFFRYMKVHKHIVVVNDDSPFEEIDVSDIDVPFIQSITLTDILEYMNYLVLVRKNNPNTRLRKISSLRRFYRFLTNQKKVIKNNPLLELETPKKKKSLPKYLTLEQSVDLLNAVDGPDKERDYCILVLFLNCGLRLSELVSINISDVRHHSSTIRITGKGNKERIVYLNEACLQAIDRYLAVRPNDGQKDKDALFVSKQHKRISPKTVQYIVKKYLAKIDLGGPGYSVHKLRHTAATLMYQHGNVDIRVLKDILGHENLGTTEIYTHLSSKQMEQAANANPLAHIKQSNLEKKNEDEDKENNK